MVTGNIATFMIVTNPNGLCLKFSTLFKFTIYECYFFKILRDKYVKLLLIKMGDSLFDIFGDHVMRQGIKKLTRQPLTNNENIGKGFPTSTKPNESLKKNETKKSFLSNTGKALQATPMRQAFTPRPINVGALIYKDSEINEEINVELEFTKPSFKYDNFLSDMHDYLTPAVPETPEQLSPPSTPPPAVKDSLSMEYEDSYEDNFFIDDFSHECVQDNDLGLPEIY